MNIKITSVSKRPEKLLDSPSAIQVITQDQIRRSGAKTLPEALRLATNLNVAQRNSQEWIVSTRGFSSSVANKMLVLIDGRTLYTPLFSGVFWERQDYLLQDIERIEVISGPGASLWGANAVNGVINIITRNSQNTQGLFLESGFGDRMEALFAARVGARLNENTSYRAYLKWFSADAEYLNNGMRGIDAWHKAQGGFRLDSQLNPSNRLSVQGDYYEIKQNTKLSDETQTKGGNLLVKWTRNYSPDANSTLQFYYDYTDYQLAIMHAQPGSIDILPAPGYLHDRLHTLDVDFQHSLSVAERNKIIWGAGYRYQDNSLTNAPGLAFYPAQLSQDRVSAFVQDEYALLPDYLSVTLGTKIEHNDYTGWEWEPSVRMQWNFQPQQMLWAAISRAVRMPSRIDRDVSQPAREFNVFVKGSEHFKSETVNAYELGYRSHANEKLILSAALFFNQYQDIRSLSPVQDAPYQFIIENNLAGDSYGLELNLSFQATPWWQVSAGYNYLNHELALKPGTHDRNNGLRETSDPENQFSLNSSMAFKEKFEFDLYWRWVDKLPFSESGAKVYTPSYSELDLRLGWHIGNNSMISISVRNLLNKRHQEFGLPRPSQEAIGRSLFAKLSIEF